MEALHGMVMDVEGSYADFKGGKKKASASTRNGLQAIIKHCMSLRKQILAESKGAVQEVAEVQEPAVEPEPVEPVAVKPAKKKTSHKDRNEVGCSICKNAQYRSYTHARSSRHKTLLLKLFKNNII